MSKLSYEAKLFWIFHETTTCSLIKVEGDDKSVQLSMKDEQGELHVYTGTLPQVIDAAYLEISPEAEAEVADEKARSLFAALTFGLVDNPLEHAAEQALYEQASS